MAKSLKEAGPTEVGAVKKRTLRQLAMGKINKDDADYIVELCDSISERIFEMEEDL